MPTCTRGAAYQSWDAAQQRCWRSRRGGRLTWEQQEHDVAAAALGRALRLRGRRLQGQQAGVPQAAHHRCLVLRLAQLLLAAAEHLGQEGWPKGQLDGWSAARANSWAVWAAWWAGAWSLAHSNAARENIDSTPEPPTALGTRHKSQKAATDEHAARHAPFSAQTAGRRQGRRLWPPAARHRCHRAQGLAAAGVQDKQRSIRPRPAVG